MEKRSKGVTILGWYLIITSITGILSNAYIFIARPAFIAKVYVFDPELIGQITSTIGIATSGLKFILGLNLLKLREMWRKITIYYYLFVILYMFLSIFIFINPVKGFGGFLASSILFGWIIYFLTRPKIREQFKTA